MKKENVLVIVLICVAVAGVIFYQNLKNGSSDALVSGGGSVAIAKDNSSISWTALSDGMTLAKEQEKHIFLYFHAQWCTYCTKLKKTTFKDRDVIQSLENSFVSIAIDTDKHKEIARQWRVTGLPTIWFLKPDGTKISNIPGYVNADQMTKFLKYIESKSYETVKFHDFVKTL